VYFVNQRKAHTFIAMLNSWISKQNAWWKNSSEDILLSVRQVDFYFRKDLKETELTTAILPSEFERLIWEKIFQIAPSK
jgi:hypothetical protein